MAGIVNMLSSALNSNVGQTLVTAGAERAAAEIYDASGFGGEEVDSPTATVEAAAAPMDAAAQPAKSTVKRNRLMLISGIGGLLGIGYLIHRVRKGGK